MQRLAQMVAQIDGKLDRLLADNTQIRADLSDHEQRLRALELGETERQRRDEARLAR
ncbi:hypothetical protein M3765_12110 [Streptomyces thermoviolaceus]|uniref:hypothetical protein n=1 Tax=Streptomyces thermoviolaceus TaxID=1952 RepID=UPI002040DF40|nr:hypothetical protein [Streptomyces thermoviolaceus]MCM3264760.1 hypothetical protein [Streptomyces thermoviolaceus]